MQACAVALSSARRHAQSSFLLIRIPLRTFSGSGSLVFATAVANVGTPVMVQLAPLSSFQPPPGVDGGAPPAPDVPGAPPDGAPPAGMPPVATGPDPATFAEPLTPGVPATFELVPPPPTVVLPPNVDEPPCGALPAVPLLVPPLPPAGPVGGSVLEHASAKPATTTAPSLRKPRREPACSSTSTALEVEPV